MMGTLTVKGTIHGILLCGSLIIATACSCFAQGSWYSGNIAPALGDTLPPLPPGFFTGPLSQVDPLGSGAIILPGGISSGSPNTSDGVTIKIQTWGDSHSRWATATSVGRAISFGPLLPPTPILTLDPQVPIQALPPSLSFNWHLRHWEHRFPHHRLPPQEQIIFLELERQRQRPGPGHGSLPPLPPTELTPVTSGTLSGSVFTTMTDTYTSFVLPVPEPTTGSLVVIGGGLLLWMARRKSA